MGVTRSLRLTRDDIGWRPILSMIALTAALFMVVNAFASRPLLSELQLWSLLIAIPGVRLFLEAWVRFVEPGDFNGLTIAAAGFALVGVSAVTDAPVLDVLGYGLVTVGLLTNSAQRLIEGDADDEGQAKT